MVQEPSPARDEGRATAERGSVAWVLLVVLGAALFSSTLFLQPHYLSRDHDWLLHVARYAFVRKSVVEFGQFPYWSPYFGGGYPILGDPAGAALTPQTPFVLILGEVLGLKVFVFCLVLLQATGMYAFARRGLRLGRGSAAFAALLLTFSSNLPMRNWDELAYGFLPLMLLLAVGVRRRPRAIWLLAALLAVALPQGKQCWGLVVLYLGLFVLVHGLRFGRRKIAAAPAWAGAVAASAAFACLLAGAKLLPMAELVQQRRAMGMMTIRNKAPFYDASTVDALSPKHLVEGFFQCPYERGVGLRSRCCVGYAGAAFVLIGLALRGRRVWRSALLLALAAVAVLGWHSPVDLLRLLWLAPGLNTMRSSAKYLDYFVCLNLCVCAAYGLAACCSLRAQWLRRGAMALAVAAVSEAAAKNLPPVLDQFRLPPPSVRRALGFHSRMPVERGPAAPRTAKGTTYFNLLAGIGTLNWESGFNLPEHAEPRQFVSPSDALYANPRYRGEAYCERGHAQAQLRRLSANRIVIAGQMQSAGIVVVNQNFHKSWQCRTRPSRDRAPLVNHEGKLAVELDKLGPFELELQFVPTAFYWGAALSLIALAGAAVAYVWGWPRERRWHVVQFRLPRAVAVSGVLVLIALGACIWGGVCQSWSKASAQYELGKQCYVLAAVSRAARHFEKALSIRPAHRLARKRLAQCRFWQGAYARSVRLFASCERMLVLESDDVTMYAAALCESGETTRASRACERWLRVAPSSPHVWASRAVVFAHEGDSAAALDAMMRAADLGLPDLAAPRESSPVRALLDGPEGRRIKTRIQEIWQSAN